MTLQKLWDIDPGYFRLKHAIKTIGAILITLRFMQHETLSLQLMACIITGFSMQGVVEKALSLRLVQIIALNSIYFLSFLLGLVVRDSANATAIALVFLGFTVNYLRRFGLQTSMAPMMAWSLCFFATTLPLPETRDVWSYFYAVVIALIVSASVNAFLFPENYHRLFIINSNRLFQALAQGMHEIRRQLVQIHQNNKQIERDAFESSALTNLSKTMSALLDSNQSIAEDSFFAKKYPHMEYVLLQQYALVNAYLMMLDTYRSLDFLLLSQERREISRLYQQFARLFASMVMGNNCDILSNDVLVPLTSFGKKTTYSPVFESIIILLNLKLGFSLFNRHIAHLVKHKNET